MCGYKDNPDEFQISSVLIGAFCISDIDFYSADTAAHFSCQYSVGDFSKPFFAEIRVSVITIKACNGQHHPLTIITLICFIVGNRNSFNMQTKKVDPRCLKNFIRMQFQNNEPEYSHYFYTIQEIFWICLSKH